MRGFVIFYLYLTIIRIPLIIENDSSRIKILQKCVCDNYNNCALLKNNKKRVPRRWLELYQFSSELQIRIAKGRYSREIVLST